MKIYEKIVTEHNFYFETAERETFVDEESVSVIRKQHYHNLFELYFLEEGTCKYFIDRYSYRIQAGDLVLIPQGVIHRTTYEKGKHRRHLIHLSCYDIPESVLPVLNSLRYVYRNPQTVETVQELFSRIGQEYERKDAYSMEILAEYVRLLFFVIARHRPSDSAEISEHPYIESAVKYLQEHYAETLTLAHMAGLYAVSREHFSRFFKRETGFGFHEYLTLLRLQKAEVMLRDEMQKNISQVAFATGFNDSNYFSERFRSEYGLSPLQYRRKYALQNEERNAKQKKK